MEYSPLRSSECQAHESFDQAEAEGYRELDSPQSQFPSGNRVPQREQSYGRESSPTPRRVARGLPLSSGHSPSPSIEINDRPDSFNAASLSTPHAQPTSPVNPWTVPLYGTPSTEPYRARPFGYDGGYSAPQIPFRHTSYLPMPATGYLQEGLRDSVSGVTNMNINDRLPPTTPFHPYQHPEEHEVDHSVTHSSAQRSVTELVDLSFNYRPQATSLETIVHVSVNVTTG